MFGAFAYVGADLHLRFGLNFTLVGLFVGTFAVGGLIYSLTVRTFVARLGTVRLAAGGGLVPALAYVLFALDPVWWLAPLAITAIGLGFYMFHNTLQTYATQMTPHARGTAVAIFSSSLYFGQTAGVSAAAPRCCCWDFGSRARSNAATTSSGPSCLRRSKKTTCRARARRARSRRARCARPGSGDCHPATP